MLLGFFAPRGGGLGEPRADLLQVGPDQLLHLGHRPAGLPQDVGRVERRDDRDPARPFEPLAALLGDRELVSHERLRRGRTQREDDARADELDLLVQVRPAVAHLVRRWRAVRDAVAGVERRPALDRVADVDVLARQVDRGQHLVEQLAGAADERAPELVLGLARPFADDHQRRAGVALAVDAVAAGRADPALPALRDDRREPVQLALPLRALLQAHPRGFPGEGSSSTASPNASTRVAPSGPSEAWNCKPITPFAPIPSALRSSISSESVRVLSASVRYSTGASPISAPMLRNVAFSTLRGRLAWPYAYPNERTTR